MPIIIAGSIDLERAEAAVLDARPYIEASQREPGCVAYSWALDPLTPGRVYVYEEWESQAALEGHFRDQSYLSMRDHLTEYGLIGSSVRKYRVDAVEPVYDDAGTPRADFFQAVTA